MDDGDEYEHAGTEQHHQHGRGTPDSGVDVRAGRW
jgi:hypothetical protein